MVSVRNQMSEPLVDIATVKREYWNRKKVPLPSLAEFHKPQGWRRFFWKKPKPYIVIRRLTHDEWMDIDSRFTNLKLKLVDELPLIRKITQSIMEGKEMTAEDTKVLLNANRHAMPLYLGILEFMVEEPDMDYEDVSIMMDALDEFDRETLVSYINVLTTEKADVMRTVQEKRLQEMTATHDSILAQVRP